MSTSWKFYLEAYEKLLDESTFIASSFIIEVDENPERNGHRFRISKVVHSSKQRSKKFESFEEIPSFQYKLENADEFRKTFCMFDTSADLSFPNMIKISIPRQIISYLDPSSNESQSVPCKAFYNP